jgi:hypothetical protein
MARPGLLLHTADLYRHMHRFDEAEQTYKASLEIDPDNAQARLGLCRVALRKKDFTYAAEQARQCVAKLYFFPMAHFLLGVARVGLRDPQHAAESFRTALSQNHHFPQAHRWLARLLRNELNDPVAAYEHFSLYRAMLAFKAEQKSAVPGAKAPAKAEPLTAAPTIEYPILGPLGDDVLVVSGLPRSGTSMLMQMLDAGGMPILSDTQREADEDNPKGYFELDAVNKFNADKSWINEARGKAVKIVAPLVSQVPAGNNYRVILIGRDTAEILNSQAKMIARRGEPVEDSPQRRERLSAEYSRVIERTRRTLSSRADIKLLILRYDEVLSDPASTANRINQFIGGQLDSTRMAKAVEPLLYRNRGHSLTG